MKRGREGGMRGYVWWFIGLALLAAVLLICSILLTRQVEPMPAPEVSETRVAEDGEAPSQP